MSGTGSSARAGLRIVAGAAGERDGAVVRAACAEAERRSAAALVLVHVIEAPERDLGRLHAHIGRRRAMLRDLYERARSTGVPSVFDVRLGRSAAAELALAADDHAADVIYVGDGTSEEGPSHLPTTSQALARTAPCMLTVVRPRRTREAPRRLVEPAPSPDERSAGAPRRAHGPPGRG